MRVRRATADDADELARQYARTADEGPIAITTGAGTARSDLRC